MAVALLFVIGYFVVRHSFAASQGDYSATVQKVMISHLQMLGVLGIFKARGTAVFNDVVNRPAEIIGGSFTSMLPVKCALQSQIYGPFLLNMSMPLIMLALAAVILIPKALGERCMRERRKGHEAPPFKGKLNLPRRLVVLTALRDPMTAADIAEWHAPFKSSQRFSGVVVFVLFSFYPTLVASVASLFNCTQAIEGSAYLVVDLTVKCYEGMHLLFMAFAFIGAVVCVYCVMFLLTLVPSQSVAHTIRLHHHSFTGTRSASRLRSPSSRRRYRRSAAAAARCAAGASGVSLKSTLSTARARASRSSTTATPPIAPASSSRGRRSSCCASWR
jgi:hypothetical protein